MSEVSVHISCILEERSHVTKFNPPPMFPPVLFGVREQNFGASVCQCRCHPFRLINSTEIVLSMNTCFCCHATHFYRPQKKAMFSQASVILSTIGLMSSQSLFILVGYSVTCYGAVDTHPNGMLSCLSVKITN